MKLSGAQVTQIAYEVRHTYTREDTGSGSVGAEHRAMERLVERITEIVGLTPSIPNQQEGKDGKG